MSIFHKKILNAVLRRDFPSFVNKVFTSVNPSTKYEPNWHIDLISNYLMEVLNGNIKRLIINIPPRSLKSVCISVAMPAWILGHDPTKRIIAASFAQNLSIKHSLDCKSVMMMDWYKELFPRTILSKKHNQKSKYLTTKHGFRMATSVGGMVTGEGGDILIIDDPHNPSHIHSSKRRNNVIEWYEQTFSSRINDKEKGVIILVMQRLHIDDLAGYLLSNFPNTWHLLKIPAITPSETIYEVAGKKYVRPENTIFHTSRYNEEILLSCEKEMGRYNFAAQYLQEPIRQYHSILSHSDVSFYTKLDIIPDFIIQSWDTAIKTSDNSDYSVCTCWAVKDTSYYLIYCYRAKLGYPELKKQVRSLAAKYNPRLILIEDHASGQSLIQDLRAEGLANIIPIKCKLDKITRFASVIPLFQSGVVRLPQNGSWAKMLLEELTLFPDVKHDDIVDSVSQFLLYMKNKAHRNLNIREL